MIQILTNLQIMLVGAIILIVIVIALVGAGPKGSVSGGGWVIKGPILFILAIVIILVLLVTLGINPFIPP